MRKFEQEVLEIRGRAEDTLKELFGWQLSESNAKKTLAVIRKYIRWVSENFPNKEKSYNIPTDINEVQIKADGSRTVKRLILLSDDDLQNPDEIMKKMGLHPLNWELIDMSMERKSWDVTMKLRELAGETSTGKPVYTDRPHKATNHGFDVKVRAKPKQFMYSEDSLKKLFESMTSPSMVIYRNRERKSKLLLESAIVDFHFGDAARYKTIEDAEELYRKAVTDQLEQIEKYKMKIGRILYVVGNDFFHFDNPQKKTVNGTQMIDTHQTEEMYERGIELNAWAIENYRAIAPVDVVLVRGNHDWLLSFTMAQFLKAYFKSCDDVTFDIDKRNRKYYRWGKCALGLGHADKEKSRLLHLMQAECSFWSDTVYREFHQAHLHSEEVKEIPGVKFRRLPTIAPKALGDWEDNCGYLSMRENQSYVWDQERGRVAVLITN